MSEAADVGAQQQRDAKRFSTAQARAALLGATLYRSDDDRGQPTYLVSRWALTLELHSLAEVEAWLGRLGGKA